MEVKTTCSMIGKEVDLQERSKQQEMRVNGVVPAENRPIDNIPPRLNSLKILRTIKYLSILQNQQLHLVL
jgi:hypothetical protein